MRIIIITDQIPPLHYGGMAQHAFHISRLLSIKHNVLLITPKHSSISNYKYPFRVLPILSISSPRFDNIKILYQSLKFNPDSIHVCCAGMSNSLLSYLFPVTIRVVGNDFNRPWVGSGLIGRKIIFKFSPNFLEPKFKKLELKIRKKHALNQLKKCKNILANSDWTKNQLIKKGIEKNKIFKIVGGLNIEVFNTKKDKKNIRKLLGISDSDFVVTTACNLVGKKGIDTAIKSLAIVLEKYKNIKYFIIGNGNRYDYLLNLVNTLNISENVIFMPAISQEKLAEYFRISDLFVQVSRNFKQKNGEIDVETMGRTYFEAGACGVPVIGSNIGGIPSVVKNGINGFLVNDPYSVDELSGIIINLYENEELRNYIAENGIKYAYEKFSWEIISKKIEEILDER
mgnify:CR=1 FL=1